jgi:hypothetical protein
MHDFRLRLPKDILAFLEAHPEIKLSKLVEKLARESLGLPEKKVKPGEVFQVRLTDEVWAAIIRTGKLPANLIRKLLTEYVWDPRPRWHEELE